MNALVAYTCQLPSLFSAPTGSQNTTKSRNGRGSPDGGHPRFSALRRRLQTELRSAMALETGSTSFSATSCQLSSVNGLYPATNAVMDGDCSPDHCIQRSTSSAIPACLVPNVTTGANVRIGHLWLRSCSTSCGLSASHPLHRIQRSSSRHQFFPPRQFQLRQVQHLWSKHIFLHHPRLYWEHCLGPTWA